MGCKNGKENRSGEKLRLKDINSPGKEREFLNDYTLGNILGQGTRGVVYQCMQKDTGTILAVKMIDKVETELSNISLEIDALNKWAHPCVARLADVYYERVFVCLVMDYCEGNSLLAAMQRYWKVEAQLPVHAIQNLTKMAFQGVAWLHSHNVTHRDLKAENYLIDKEEIDNPGCRLYITDFGTVVELSSAGQRLHSQVGNWQYRSPEVWAKDYGLPADVWAVGVMMFGLGMQEFPFDSEEEVFDAVIVAPCLGPLGEDLLHQVLCRQEARRVTAEDALAHEWLSEITSAAEAAEEARRVTAEFLAPESLPEITSAKAAFFAVPSGREDFQRVDGSEFTHWDLSQPFHRQPTSGGSASSKFFEWWNPAAVRKAVFYDEDLARRATFHPDGGMDFDAGRSEEAISQMLGVHNIDIGNFGVGMAKSFAEFVRELNSGQARLMIHLSQHKRLVRVVDIVLLRVVHGEGVDRRYLLKTKEIYPDGRERSGINQLNGFKKHPHENGMRCVQRVMRERMAALDGHVKFDFFNMECFDEEDESPSYPGVRTVYRKEIYEAQVTTTNPLSLEGIGLAGASQGTFSETDRQGCTRVCEWLSKLECAERRVRLEAPEKGSVVSGLVGPKVNYREADLEEFLQDQGVDPSLFGYGGSKTLQQLWDELACGESVFERTEDGLVIRMVDLVVLHITNVAGDTLVEVSRNTRGHPRGGVQATNVAGVTSVVEVPLNSGDNDLPSHGQLPAVKRRADENIFTAAHRLISHTLRLPDNAIHMSEGEVLTTEECHASKGYAGLPALYRRRIIPAHVDLGLAAAPQELFHDETSHRSNNEFMG